ncbi:MAG: hypothetical protein IJA44_01620 [Clostridia bacterium]|nr:hypothetical protein [Clostridia bacterium]
MKNSIKRILSVFVILMLVFSMLTVMPASADESQIKLPEGFEFIEDEVYSFREVLDNITYGLDPASLEQVFFDGFQWNVTTQQRFTDGPWNLNENWYIRETPDKDLYGSICVNNSTEPVNSEIWKNHEMMIEWNVADTSDKNIYWSLQPLWSCAATTWINFVAPHTGKIVLFEEFGNQIKACATGAPFYAFENNREFHISVLKNDVKVWPVDEEYVVLNSTTRAIDFPSLGKTGAMPVTEGDVIAICIDVGGEFEGFKGMTTATFNPVIAYTEIESQVVNDDNSSDLDYIDGYENNNNTNVNNTSESNDLGWILYVIIGCGVLLVIAVVVIVIFVSKKKKSVDLLTPVDEPALDDPANEEIE